MFYMIHRNYKVYNLFSFRNTCRDLLRQNLFRINDNLLMKVRFCSCWLFPVRIRFDQTQSLNLLYSFDTNLSTLNLRNCQFHLHTLNFDCFHLWLKFSRFRRFGIHRCYGILCSCLFLVHTSMRHLLAFGN